MKRVLVFFLILSCLFGMIACTQVPRPTQGETNFNERPLSVVGAHSDVEVLSIQASSLCTYPDLPDEWYLSVNWNNKTEQYVQCAEIEYWVERMENGQWVSCMIQDKSCSVSDYELRPIKGECKTYDIKDVFDLSTSGSYRFFAICDITIGDKTYADSSFWTEFIIE